MASMFDALPLSAKQSINWIPDEDVTHCMICHAQFGLLTRKHHCRNCGKVICYQCSPHTKKIHHTDSHPSRVCNLCYTTVDVDHGQEWGSNNSMPRSGAPVAGPIIEGKSHIGQLFIKVVEAIGLPSIDTISNDPYVKVTLTGKWSHGQEWGPSYRCSRETAYKMRTLNPRYNESFIFNVYAPGAEILLEVYSYSQIGQGSLIGMARLSIAELMDQIRHKKWIDLNTPEKSRTGASDLRAGRLHVLMQYKFSKVAEFLSYYSAEEPFQPPWPQFQAATLYSNFWVFLSDLWPYVQVFLAITPILQWEQPSRSAMWFCILVWTCLYIHWLPVMLHGFLIYHIMRNYYVLSIKTETNVNAQASATLQGQTVVDDQTPVREYKLPQGFNHLTNRISLATLDSETKTTLQNVQNNFEMISNCILSLEKMFSWEDPMYTTNILAILSFSLLLHLIFPNRYLLLVVVVYIFIMDTVPFRICVRYTNGMAASFQSLMHQRRLKFATKKRAELHTSIIRKPISNGAGSNRSKHISRQEQKIGAAAAALSRKFSSDYEKTHNFKKKM